MPHKKRHNFFIYADISPLDKSFGLVSLLATSLKVGYFHTKFHPVKAKNLPPGETASQPGGLAYLIKEYNNVLNVRGWVQPQIAFFLFFYIKIYVFWPHQTCFNIFGCHFGNMDMNARPGITNLVNLFPIVHIFVKYYHNFKK